MTVVVTGASSFIGRFLVNELFRREYDCIAVVRRGFLDKSIFDQHVRVVEADMSDYKELISYTGKADCLINLSWIGTRGADRMDSCQQEKSFNYSMDAIKCFADSGVKYVFTAGSQAEYGRINGYIKETDEPVPNTEYGKYKLKLFEAASDYCESRGVKLIEPRFFSLFGPGDYKGSMIMDILFKMIRGEECNLTMGIQMWDYLYIRDAIDAVIALMSDKVEPGAYNVASGNARKLKDYVLEMKRITGSTSSLNFGIIPYPASGMVSIMADIGKIQSNTGWSAKTSFEEGLREVIQSL